MLSSIWRREKDWRDERRRDEVSVLYINEIDTRTNVEDHSLRFVHDCTNHSQELCTNNKSNIKTIASRLNV